MAISKAEAISKATDAGGSSGLRPSTEESSAKKPTPEELAKSMKASIQIKQDLLKVISGYNYVDPKLVSGMENSLKEAMNQLDEIQRMLKGA